MATKRNRVDKGSSTEIGVRSQRTKPAKSTRRVEAANEVSKMSKVAKKPTNGVLSTTKKRGGESLPEREVIYPIREVIPYSTSDGDKGPLDATEAKRYLGWKELEPGSKEGHPVLQELFKKPIIMTNNTRNQPIDIPQVKTLGQDMLNRRWKYNMDTIKIGKTGQVGDGQKRFLALIWAEAERLGPQKPHWEEYWDGPVTIETLIAVGVDEDDDTFQTYNSGQVMGPDGVIYRSDYFIDKGYKERLLLSRTLANCVARLWDRTGVSYDPFNKRRTNSEVMDFIHRHPRTLDAVRHVIAEESEGSVSRYTRGSLGYAAALLYLMGASATDNDEYAPTGSPAVDRSEKKIDFSRWDKAEEFWVLLSQEKSSSPGKMASVTEAIARLRNVDTDKVGSQEEIVATTVLAWVAWIERGVITTKDLSLKKYGTNVEKDKKTVFTFTTTPDVGGIDLGKVKETKVTKGDLPEPDAPDKEGEPEEEEKEEESTSDPTPEEIKAKAAEERRLAAKERLLAMARKKREERGETEDTFSPFSDDETEELTRDEREAASFAGLDTDEGEGVSFRRVR